MNKEQETLKQVAKTFVYKKPEVLKLLQRWGFKAHKPTNAEMLQYLLYMFNNSYEFNQEFAELALIDNPKTKNESDAIASIIIKAIGDLGQMTGQIFQHSTEKNKIKAEQENKLLDFIGQMENNKAMKNQPQSDSGQYIFAAVLIVVMIGFVGFLIYNKSKKRNLAN